MRTSELQVYNLTNIKVVEGHHNNFRCFTVSLTSTDYDGNSYTTDLKIFSENTEKSFHDYIPEEEVKVIG